ncbi:MAG: bifunctional phosphopantothenoylcysteine decarboxylase/phosphopantothenate--cysteine ligase CoaBC [Micropepsaceae bacterium]
MLSGKRILLIIGGGIAAYKSLELIRLLRQKAANVRCILSSAGSQFVTPLSVSGLSGDKVYQDLFSLTDEADMGHIQLSRDADLLVVAPATADLIAKIAHGRADDLASTALLATDKPVLVAPAMNVRMWLNAATQRNIAQVRADGVRIAGPNEGDMACGEFGPGRMAEPAEILAAIETQFGQTSVLAGRRALVTAGPTIEPIDPIRYISNRSSGKQGYAIATALARLGAETTLVTGPTSLQSPLGVKTIRIESAQEMLAACEKALPVDVAVFTAAVADWRVSKSSAQKIKKDAGNLPDLSLVENPDILRTIANHPANRPELVIGFAAETENVIAHAQAKRKKKACDWIVANDVSPERGVMGGDENTVHIITKGGNEAWPKLTKQEVADRLVRKVAQHLGSKAK